MSDYKHPLYETHRTMLKRCYYPTAAGYHKYGGRRINVCDQWKSVEGFRNFVRDMGVKPDGTSLDRIDNDGNYTPNNCKWSTPLEQARNRGAYLSNSAGCNGVSKDKKPGKWRARIKVAGREIYIGTFTDIKEAIKARKTAEKEYWGDAYV